MMIKITSQICVYKHSYKISYASEPNFNWHYKKWITAIVLLLVATDNQSYYHIFWYSCSSDTFTSGSRAYAHAVERVEGE